MNILPAIDLLGGKAVRLVRGDYDKVTVYSDTPLKVAEYFEEKGAKYLHIVDLDGARDGTTANFDTIETIVKNTTLSVEVGGGIRDLARVKRYVDLGVDRIILGTAALEDEAFLKEALALYGDKIVVGVDIRDGMVAVKGWLEVSNISCFEFCEKLEKLGVKTVICTDISKDGMMAGTNVALYRELSEKFGLRLIASGGVSTLGDIERLSAMGLFGAIVGKAIYTGAVSLEDALACAKEART